MSRKHIIQISSYYPPHLGGQENAVHDLAIKLAEADHEVDVVASALGAPRPGVKQEEGVRVHRLSGRAFGHAPIMPHFPLTLWRLAQPKSVIHLHIGQAFTPEMVWLVSALKGRKYIAQLHIDFEPSGPAGVLLPLYKKLLLTRVLQSAAAVVTLNQETQQILYERYNRTKNVHLLNNGIDEIYFTLKRKSFMKNPPNTLNLLFVGRLSNQKNLLTLLDALAKTRRSVHLDVIGEGEQRYDIEEKIARLGLDTVTLHGRLPRKDILAFYQTCDALIMPSLYEAQPLVLLEAMAARIPIIGTNVIGIAEHIKDAGIIVEPTVEGLLKGIEQFYARYQELPQMVSRGHKAAEHFRWQHTIKKYEALYDTVLEN